MLDYLHFEIQLEIMKRFPVKSLLQFRSLSKSWKSLIDSSAFVAHYHTHLQHILVAYKEAGDVNPKYVSVADDETFPQQKVSPTIPLLVNMLKHSTIIGSSHGLVCLQGVYPKSRGGSNSETDMVFLWNLSIRRAIAVVVPNVVYGMYETVIGFGVCRVTTDPKIIKITSIKSNSNIETISSIPWQVEVFTLSTGVWRRPYSTNLPRKSILFDWWWRVFAGGFLYWLASDRITMDGGYTSYHLIMSFDITTEEFREVDLPHSLAHESRYNLSMSKLRESLVVLHQSVEANNPVIGVWLMENGFSNLFTKLFTINVNTPDAKVNAPDARVRAFRKSGEPIIQISEDDLPIFKLVVYDPYCIDYLGINGTACTFFVSPYTETLLLLDKPDFAAYNELETIRFLDDLVS